MSYLIAKRTDEIGCYAIKTKPGKHLSNLVREMNTITVGKGIKIVLLSNPDVFGEYAPYRYLKSEAEFREKVSSMITA